MWIKAQGTHMLMNVNVIYLEEACDDNGAHCGYAITGAPTLSDFMDEANYEPTVLGVYASQQKAKEVYLDIIKAIKESRSMYEMPNDEEPKVQPQVNEPDSE